MNMAPITGKFDAFGWATTEIDGNDMGQILAALDRVPLEPGRPTAVIAHTIKAKGISPLEGTVDSHYWKPKAEELAAAVRELDATVAALEQEAAK